MTTPTEKFICKQCGTPLQGRVDKKFCDAHCRNAYNNQVKRSDEQFIQQINRALRKNRKILKTLSPVGKSTVRKEVMAAMGYDFNLFSSMYKAPSGNLYYLCYDFGFMPIFDPRGIAKAVIITRQNYMDKWSPWQYIRQQPPPES